MTTSATGSLRASMWLALLATLGLALGAAPVQADPPVPLASAWGAGGNGQLGNGGPFIDEPMAVATSGVLAGKSVTGVSAGDTHTCVVADGQVFCWGSNNHGQLGNNSTADSTVPVVVNTGALAGKTVTQVSAGGALTCALAAGNAYCWGWGTDGQLGNGTNGDSSVPVAVDRTGVLAGKTVTQVAAGGRHACAVASGKAFCWGYGGNQALGNGYGGSATTPVAVNDYGVLAGKTVTAIAASSPGWNFIEHTCAVADGKAYCWGANRYGQLGNGGSTGWEAAPVAVDTTTGLAGKIVSAISISETSSCAVADSQLYCWGSTGTLKPALVASGGLAGKSVSAISNGKYQRCAIAQGLTFCWQGLGTLPTAVSGALAGRAVSGVSAGDAHACAVAASNVYCWGNDAVGQLGRGRIIDSSSPVDVVSSGALAGKPITDIDAGGSHTCAVAGSGVYCWGDGWSGQLGVGSTRNASVPVAVRTAGALAGKTVTRVSAGGSHTCVVASGRAFCWGQAGQFDEDGGAIGDGTGNGVAVPVAVDTSGALAAKTVTDISAGGYHTCAVADQKAYCWGTNYDGELGDGTQTGSASPVGVNAAGVLAHHAVNQVSAGWDYSCAVADGRAYCWGKNDAGQLGNGSNAASSVPVEVSGVLAGKTVRAISAGSTHTCAVADGKAYCWGKNDAGQLGNGSNTASSVPVEVSGVLAGKTVTAVSTGATHTCAIADAVAYCWGKNDKGQLGDSTNVASSVPVRAGAALSGVIAITAGGGHTAALSGRAVAPMAPDAPTAVLAAPGDAQVSVSWTPPVSDGGSAVVEYEAVAAPGGQACTSGGTSCTVAGLTNGQPYTFTVRARNAVGWSLRSAASEAATPQAPVPQAPVVEAPQNAGSPTEQPVASSPSASGAPAGLSRVKTTFRKGRVIVTWQPTSGASAYKVRITKPGGKKYVKWRHVSSTRFSAKVSKGKKYRLQIVAIGAGGSGPVKTVTFTG